MIAPAARFVAAAIGIAALTVSGAQAQDYPTRPVTMVVPFTPGGAGDTIARVLGPKLEQAWGKPLVVENRPGAGGIIGANITAKAAPDGYTLMIAPSATMAINISLYKSLSYDPANDFVPLALAARTAFVLVVNADLPVKTVPELIAYVKARPGQVTYATSGPGTPHHLFAELLKTMTGIDMSPVVYRGSAPAVTDVAAGHVPLMFVDVGPALGAIQSGKVRALAVSTGTRVALLPDVPPMSEAGVPRFEASSWQMIVAPAKTPRPIVDKLHGQLKGVLAMPDIGQQLATHGFLPADNPSVESLQAFVKSEIERWSKVVQQAGIAGSM